MKPRGYGINMEKQYEIIRETPPPDVQVGEPCDTCAQLEDRSWRMESGVGYCRRFCTWNRPFGREWDCKDHVSRDALEGKLMVLSRALTRMCLGIEMLTGDNVGTMRDPRHATTPTPRKRKPK